MNLRNLLLPLVVAAFASLAAFTIAEPVLAYDGAGRCSQCRCPHTCSCEDTGCWCSLSTVASALEDIGLGLEADDATLLNTMIRLDADEDEKPFPVHVRCRRNSRTGLNQAFVSALEKKGISIVELDTTDLGVDRGKATPGATSTLDPRQPDTSALVDLSCQPTTSNEAAEDNGETRVSYRD